MEGREAMTISGGSAQYFMHKAGLGSASGPQSGGMNTPPSHFRALANAHRHHVQVATQPSVRTTLAAQAFTAEPPPPSSTPDSFGRGNISMGAVSTGPPSGEQTPKKKRGRPRKYGPNGKVALGLLLMSNSAPCNMEGAMITLPKKARGRPPGSGRKQRLASVGDWMNNTAGFAFAPHVIRVATGEDVAAKILSFSQQRPRAVCVLSGCGAVSLVTLRQPASSGSTITYEGRFEILCLSGSYLPAEEGGPRNRTGGVSVSLSSPDGHVIGGSVGVLIAAGPVQVVTCSFVYGSSKVKDKQIVVAAPKVEEESAKSPSEGRPFALSSGPSQNFASSAIGVWQNSQAAVDLKHLHTTGIDLTRG